jgi:hypothetical protein
MRKVLWLVLALGVVAVGLVFAGANGVKKQTVWIVPWDHQGLLQVTPGDIIEVWTKPLAVIPENLESTFRTSKEGRGVELVGQTLPHKEGTMERLYFFKTFDVGPATLKVELLGPDGSVRETFLYEVEVKTVEK